MVKKYSNYSKREIINTVCLYYARYKTKSPVYLNWENDCNLLAKFGGKAIKGVKNVRDIFDPYFDNNGRKGWWQRTLEKQGEQFLKIYEKYKEYSDEDFKKIVLEMMHYVSECCDKDV